MRGHVLIFDSGVGGLSVARAVRRQLPEVALTYAADNAAFPYGKWKEASLIGRIEHVVGELVDRIEPDAVIIACNTASTIALAALRQRFPLPFVGTVPAIKPAAEATKSGIIGVLATPGTVKRDYTRALIDTYAYHCRVILYGAPQLAEMAEKKLSDSGVGLRDLATEIGPVFREIDGKKTDTVVLGCTHYPLLLPELEAAAPWPVIFIDPAPAIARRLATVLSERDLLNRPQTADADVILTAGQAGALLGNAVFAREGFRGTTVHDLPV